MVQFVVTNNVLSTGTAFDLNANVRLIVTGVGSATSQNGSGMLGDGGLNSIVIAGHVAALSVGVPATARS